MTQQQGQAAGVSHTGKAWGGRKGKGTDQGCMLQGVSGTWEGASAQPTDSVTHQGDKQQPEMEARIQWPGWHGVLLLLMPFGLSAAPLHLAARPQWLHSGAGGQWERLLLTNIKLSAERLHTVVGQWLSTGTVFTWDVAVAKQVSHSR